ncbi:MAG: hypothetical protein M3R17_04475 [Bacteroidota bacterium]|nr:hypothetical protein [Bacteroidota bacterium]
MKTKSKITALFLIIAALAIPTIQSCKKYPEGPSVSLRSREERVANTWKVENYKINSTDYTSLVAGYEQTFSKGGAYSYSWGSTNGSGTWAFQNEEAEIRITGVNSQPSETLYILKLKEKEFWYYIMDGNDKHEYHLLQK